MKRQPILLVLLTVITLNSCHFGRALIYYAPDNKDYKKFPEREVKTSTTPYNWAKNYTRFNQATIQITKRDSSTMPLQQFLKTSKTNMFMVIKNDTIIYENYRNKYNANTPHFSFSVAKSLVNACLGIAINEGHIASINEPITNYIPELLDNDPRFKNISINHLLTMTSGIYHSDRDAAFFGDLAKVYYGNNFMRYMGRMKIETEPGKIYEYKQADTQMLVIIIARATGATFSNYFQEKIWQKIGTTQNAFFNLTNKNGYEKAYCCFRAVLQDYAKFARLIMYGGSWNGQQIIPNEWIEQTTHLNWNNNNPERIKFNCHWFPAENCNELTAQGHLGQYIYINRTENIIILRFGNRRWNKHVNFEDVLRQIAKQVH